MVKRLLACLVLVVSTFSFINVNSVAQAVTGSDFKAGNIIDDSLFFNGNDMTAEQVQSFLNSKVVECDTNGLKLFNGVTRAQYGASRGNPPPYVCLKDYSQVVPGSAASAGLCEAVPAGTKTAAQIVHEVGQACGVNPKALLVLLEKEQSLVTDDWPWQSQYRAATGYGCPDTAPCDEQYVGFYNQVYNAARQFKRYQTQPAIFSYKSGRDNYIRYNPNIECGGSNVFIENQATAGLYNYTPYQPNAAALDSLYGTGDSCSAYGNRNFWRLYNDWFGSTVAPKPAPTATISVNDQPQATVAYGSTATLKWNSTNATSCTVTPDNFTGVTGQQVFASVTQSKDYKVDCTGASGTASATAKLTVLPPTFEYLERYVTNAAAQSGMNPAQIRIVTEQLKQAKLRYDSKQKAAGDAIVNGTITNIDAFVRNGQMRAEYGAAYKAAATLLIATYTPTAPTPPPVANGGYPDKWALPAIDTVLDTWGHYNRQATSYAAFKVAQSGRQMPYGFGNSNQWDDRARARGIAVDTNPRVGDVAVSNAGYYGHVMYVEAVNANGTISVSQYNAAGNGQYSTNPSQSKNNLVFIHF